MFGDEVLGKMNIDMVETARHVGAGCKFTGSGGAVIALCPHGDHQAEKLRSACELAGFAVQLAVLGPPNVRSSYSKTMECTDGLAVVSAGSL